MITTTVILVGLVIVAGLFLMTRKVEAIGDSEDLEETLPEKEAVAPVEEKVEAVKESAEEMEARLKTLANPDSDKPFAKISVPEVSETPTESGEPEATEPKEKKRSYKKRAPKVKKGE
jgi:hypothetical protein